MSVAGVRICSIDWDSFPFTDLTVHVAVFFSISSFQCDYGLLRRLTLVWVIFRHSRISQGPQIHRSTDLPIHESTNHDPTNPLIYPRIHKHLHLAHHAQGKGKTCGVLHLSRIYQSIHGFTSPQSTNPQIYESIIPRHLRISQGPRIYRSTDLPIHESMNHDPTNPLIYPRIHKHLHLAHHAQGKGKTCGVLRLSRIHESIYGFTSLQSTNPQIYKSINPRIHKSMSKSSYLGVPPSPHCVLPTAFCTLYQGTRQALWCFASVKCFVVWLTFS